MFSQPFSTWNARLIFSDSGEIYLVISWITGSKMIAFSQVYFGIPILKTPIIPIIKLPTWIKNEVNSNKPVVYRYIPHKIFPSTSH